MRAKLVSLALTYLFLVAISKPFKLGILSDVHIGEGCASPYNYEEDCYSV